MLYQPVGGDMKIKSGPRKKNWMDAMVTTTATTAGDILVMELPFVFFYIIHHL